MNSIGNYNIYTKPQYINKTKMPNKANQRNITFTGSKDPSIITKALAKPIEYFVKSKPMKGFSHWIAKGSTETGQNKRLDLLQDAGFLGLSATLDALYISQTLKNKKIEKERKKTLAINQGITMVCSLVGALTLDRALNKTIGKVKAKVGALNPQMSSEKLGNVKNGIGILKKAIIVAVVYRYIAPVVATPLSDKITKAMKKRGWLNNSKDKQPPNKTEQSPHK